MRKRFVLAIVLGIALVFTVILTLPKSHDLSAQRPPAQDRQYKLIIGDFTEPASAALLNDAARGGWRLAAMVGGRSAIFEK